MKSWWLVIALLLSLGINLGIVATMAANRWGRKPKPPLEEPLPPPAIGEGPQRAIRLADRLGLEGEERRQFIALQGKFFVETVQLRTDLAETQRELRRELTSEKPDQAHIDVLLTDSARIFRSLEQAMTRNVVESRRMLDPDQEKEFLRFVALLRPPGLGGGRGEGGQGQRPPQRRPRRDADLEGPQVGGGADGPEVQEGPPDRERPGEPPPPLRPRMGRGGWLRRHFGGPLRPRRWPGQRSNQGPPPAGGAGSPPPAGQTPPGPPRSV